VVVSVSLLASLIGIALWIWRPDVARPFPMFFPNSKVTIFGAPVTAHQLVSLGCGIAIAAILAIMLRVTRLGIDMRAVVDSRPLLMVNGGRPDRVAMASWAIGSSLAALAGILIAPTLQLSVVPLTLTVVNAYAAAVIGKLRSLPLTFLGALLIGLADSYGIGYLPMDIRWLYGIRPALPVIILFIALLLVPHARPRGAQLRTREWFPTSSTRRLLVGAVVFVALSALVAPQLSIANVFTLNRALAFGIIGLSMVPLVGYANQLSLCQLSFGAIGALAMAALGKGGNPFGLLSAFALAAAAGALVALPVLRLRGIYLALATAAFAVLLDRWLFTLPNVNIRHFRIPLFGIGGASVDRLRIGPIHFTSDSSQTILLAVMFSLFAGLIVWIRRSRFGRILLAMRESETACATLGLKLRTAKLGVFALSAGIAGVGGALLGGVYENATPSYFTFFGGLQILLLAVVGGIGAVSGISLAVVFLAVTEWISRTHPGSSDLINCLPGLAGIGLARNPGGVASDLAQSFAGLAGLGRRRRSAPDVPLELVGVVRPIGADDVAAADRALGVVAS
jgi:branched-chain amino acid transport system permease protein